VLATFFKAEPHAIGDNLLEIVPRRNAVTNNSDYVFKKKIGIKPLFTSSEEISWIDGNVNSKSAKWSSDSAMDETSPSYA
jgi:hypothetical protein